MKNICIVTPTYISSNPRLVKEADAFWQAGYSVRVVFSRGDIDRIRQYDEILLSEKPWQRQSVGWSPFRKDEMFTYWKSKLRFHFVRRLPGPLWKFHRLPEHAEGRIYSELAALASSERADMYIGHYPTGLAAAAFAASRWGSRLGYDIEDLHTEENSVNPIRDKERIRTIEGRYLRRSSHVTAASELIADEIANRYNVARPTVIHNVFPLKERDRLDGQKKDRKGARLSLYWYSQVIGEDRGISDAIRAAGLLRGKVQVHLRGAISEEVKNRITALARHCGIANDLYLHPPVPARELLSRAAEHDVGLALEQPVNLNRQFSVTNKFFFYLLSGLAVAATDVPGQRSVMSGCMDAGFLYKAGDYRSLANNLEALLTEPKKLELCKAASLKAACEKWNWEMESQKLINTISSILGN